MNAKIRQKLARRKRRLQRRLDPSNSQGCAKPMMTASNIHYELSDRGQGINHGGIGAIHALAHRIGLIDTINARLHLLKFHLPYHESDHVKDAIVVAREFECKRLQAEWVGEFPYQPTACARAYRMVVVKKNISITKGEQPLFDDIRYFFYITNDWEMPAAEVVLLANDRCNQENLIAQLSSGVRALQAPVDNLVSNWAYMVMTSLAWNLKAWWALMLPAEPGRWQERHEADKRRVLGLEFKTFRHMFVELPCQIIRSGGRLIYRLLSWNPELPIFFRLVDRLRC